MNFLKKLLRTLLIVALIAYFAMAAIMLSVRYLVLPHVNAWRPQIEQILTESIGSPVTLGEVNANWSRLNPTLSILNLSIHTSQGTTLLNIPQADAIVSWRSLLALDLHLKYLDIKGIDISIEKQADGNLSVAGYVLNAMPETEFKLDSDTLAVRWLLGQGEIFVNNATLRWRDLQRGSPELVLTDVDLALSNGFFSHSLLIRGSAPESVAKSFELVARADHSLGPLGSITDRHAELYIEFQDLAPASLMPWIDVPEISGRFAGRAWVDVQQGKLAATRLEIEGSKVGASLPSSPSTAIFAQQAKLSVSGLLGDLLPMIKSDLLAVSTGAAAVADVQASAEGATFDNAIFQPSLVVVQKANLTAKLANLHEQVSAHLESLTLSNAHLEINLKGDWQAGGNSDLGIANLTGMIVKLSASELHRYLTVNVDQLARQWLRESILEGEFRQAAITVQGDLSEFPFNKPDQKGIYKIDGIFQNLLLNYYIVKGSEKGWPALAYTNGSIHVDKGRLAMHSDSGSLLGARGERIKLNNLNINIPDMELKPDLSVDMLLSAEAGLFINALRETPLNERLGGLFNELSATGNWSIPMSIRANLHALDKLQSKGRIEFSGGNLAWGETFPALESVQGSLLFSNDLIEADKFQAKFLGESLTVQGTLSQPGTQLSVKQNKGLIIDGILPFAALSKFTQAPALSVFEGSSRFRAQIIQNNKEGVDVAFNSKLDGVSIVLPAPIGKTKETVMPFSLKWSSTKQSKAFRQSVSFNLGESINGKLERLPNTLSKTFFTRAAIATGSTSVLPPAGMDVNLSLGEIDWANWQDLSTQLSSEKVASDKNSFNLLPQLQSFSMRSPRLLIHDHTFTDLSVTITQAEKGQWSTRLDSKETAGVISWKESSGAVAGRVIAKFTKLALGRAPTDEEQTPKIHVIDDKQWSDIPAVDLNIDDFTLFGSRLGSLRLIGANTERGSIWNISNLEIKNLHSTLSANGQWRLKGENKGIKLNADLAISDLGKLSSFMGYPDKVTGGSGSVKADIDWVNFPWAFSYAGMAGTADVALKNGVFDHVNSRSARLLELLSLQSLQRILSFNFRPGNEFQNGFPWESISGKFVINRGVAKTDDLTIFSPVASIMFAGDSDLDQKTYNLNADVKPKFDLSGSAVASGFLVNPLVGVSALVTQFLLRNPIERAMTAKYQVRGPWDDPTLIPLDIPAPKPEGQKVDPGG